jgi:hypothetical protein
MLVSGRLLRGSGSVNVAMLWRGGGEPEAKNLAFA